MEEREKREAPQRSCIGCGAKRPKRELNRLVLMSEGQPALDTTQTAPGRGAYLCGEGCLKAAIKRKALQRAFRGKARTLELTALEALLRGSR
ncbi:MAG: YlxR family protein [Myxococcaceae bacterium]